MNKPIERLTPMELARRASSDADQKKRGRLIVPLADLREDPRNERRTYAGLDELTASIKSVGLIEPITVTPIAAVPGKFQIITGHRRYRAAVAAGLKQVEILIREPMDELNRRTQSIISNVQREDVNPIEMAEALRLMLDEHPELETQADLAKMIGKDKRWLSGMLQLLRLPADVRQTLRSAKETISYDPMIRIARITEPTVQREMVDLLLSGANQTTIRQRIAERASKGESSPALKPKRKFDTDAGVVIIVQSLSRRLTREQIVDGLEQALDAANQ